MSYDPSGNAGLGTRKQWTHIHLMFRREIIRQQKLAGKHVLAIDSNLFLWRDPNKHTSLFKI